MIDARDRTDFYKTPLHVAVLHCNWSMMGELIERGAGVDATDINGRSPLFYTTKIKNSSRIAGKLLDAGANINLEDDHKRTTLDYCNHRVNNHSLRI